MMKIYGKWAFLIGLLVSILASLADFSKDWLYLILLLVAIFAGFVFFDTDKVKKFSILYMAFILVKGAYHEIPALGEYLDKIFDGAAMFIAPVLLTVLVHWFVKKFFLGKE
jgi:hypothetical protein